MDLHHQPCRGYRANQAVLSPWPVCLGPAMGDAVHGLPKKVRRHGIRSIFRYVMRTAAGILRLRQGIRHPREG